jgi:hypothetical protein
MSHTSMATAVGLLLPGDPSKVFLGNGKQSLELAHAVLADIPGLMGGAGTFEQPDCFLMVCLGHVQGMFEGGLVLKCRFVVHATSVVPFPG